MNQQRIYLCYKTDKWHSIDSKRLVYIGEDIEDCIAQIDAHRGGLSETDKYDLRHYRQTQSHTNDFEWCIDQELTNAFCD